MKRMTAMIVVVLMLVTIMPQNVYASEVFTPSGISYDDSIEGYTKGFVICLKRG